MPLVSRRLFVAKTRSFRPNTDPILCIVSLSFHLLQKDASQTAGGADAEWATVVVKKKGSKEHEGEKRKEDRKDGARGGKGKVRTAESNAALPVHLYTSDVRDGLEMSSKFPHHAHPFRLSSPPIDPLSAQGKGEGAAKGEEKPKGERGNRGAEKGAEKEGAKAAAPSKPAEKKEEGAAPAPAPAPAATDAATSPKPEQPAVAAETKVRLHQKRNFTRPLVCVK